MNIHIICPLWRTHLVPTLIHYLEPMNIQWHPIMTAKEQVDFDPPWVHPLIVEEHPTDKTFRAFRKPNEFIRTQEIIDDDYYGFMSDEDMYEPGFFDVIRKQTAKILMFSLYRGDTLIKDGPKKIHWHPATPLIVNGFKNIKVGSIGLPQYIIKGSILKVSQFRNDHYYNDGHFAMMLAERFPHHIKFLPDLFVFAAYLQLGRYTKKEAFLKPNWELPVIIYN